MHAGLIWLIVAALLAVGEFAVGDFFLLMLGGGALAGAAAAGLGAPVWGQVLAFALVTVLLLGVIRPVARRRLLAALPEHESGAAALPGRQGTVVEAVGPQGGLVEVAGDTWTARIDLEGESIPVGEKVWIDKIDGATVVVIRAV